MPPFSRSPFRIVPVVLAGAMLVAPLQAKAQPDTLAWELVGEPFDVRGIFADTARGTVYAVGFDGLFSTQSDEDAWALVAPYSDLSLQYRDVFVSNTGTLFVIRSSVIRSADGGETWEEVLDNGQLAPVYTPAGALVTNLDGSPTVTLARSTDDGLTWERIDMAPTLGGRIFPITFAVLPPSATLPGGRLVAGGNGGLVVSSDDGLSWAETALTGPFRATSAVRAPWDTPLADGTVDPGRGTLYAVANDLAPGGQTGEVWESTDGEAWERAGRVPGVGGTGGQLVAARGVGGAEMLYAIAVSEQEYEVYASKDRGRTWVGTGVFPAVEMVGGPVDMEELTVGPEGRLWLALSPGPGANRLGGVFRTTEAVVAVAAEPDAEDEPGKHIAELGAAYPNPSDGTVTLSLVLAEMAEVRLVIYDMLGREVAVLTKGVLATGRHDVSLETAGFPAGVYVVRATVRTADGAVRSFEQRLTVID